MGNGDVIGDYCLQRDSIDGLLMNVECGNVQDGVELWIAKGAGATAMQIEKAGCVNVVRLQSLQLIEMDAVCGELRGVGFFCGTDTDVSLNASGGDFYCELAVEFFICSSEVDGCR